MVYKNNTLPFDHNGSLQHARELDGTHFLSSGHRHNFEEQYTIGGPQGDFEFQNDGTSYGNLLSAPGSHINIESKTENIKRPGEDETLQFTAKRVRWMDENFSPVGGTHEGSFRAFTTDDEFKNRNDSFVSQRDNGSPRLTCDKNIEGSQLETPVRHPYFPGHYEDHRRPARYNKVDESESFVFNSLPRKLVTIGPDHQADIPTWRPKHSQGSCTMPVADDSMSSARIQSHEDSSDKWIRHCVTPMPDPDLLCLESPLGRLIKTDCCCLDEGSIRCVRQHVMEARAELRTSLGRERFVNLGFFDMGEDVALRWTEEDEQLFQEVVAMNPASLGRNFWDILPRAFPSRSSKEIVSYYFNVFILRKRAEQNRYDPSNVDSDNDEWQDSDAEFGAAEEDHESDSDSDSGVESPADAAADVNRTYTVDVHEEEDADGCCEGEEDSSSEGSPADCKPTLGPNALFAGEEQDVHDDSCTSFEGVSRGSVETSGEGAAGLMEGYHGTPYDFIAGHCDSRPWDMNYFYGLDKDLDFLPTCNVIEEVFGKESWEKRRGGDGVS